MALLPDLTRDPTLEAIDKALESTQSTTPRDYLGMSAVGGPCDRALWYGFRWCSEIRFDAATLKRFVDGEMGENLQASRLRLVQGIELHTHDDRGRQYGFYALGGHLRGHFDGAILGLLQAPKTWHVWEHKQVDEKKHGTLRKAKEKHGEKGALAAWDETYHSQGQLYMHFSGMSRHYLTCSTPGGRYTIGVRTDYHRPTALRLIERANRIIAATEPPPKLSEDPDYFECRWCDHRAVCHQQAIPLVSCRTCLHATPELEGDRRWSCAFHHTPSLPVAVQRNGCPAHLYIPALLPWPAVDASVEENSVTYEGGMKNGGPDGTLSTALREVVGAHTV